MCTDRISGKLWIIVLMSMLMAVITIVVNVILMHKKDVM